MQSHLDFGYPWWLTYGHVPIIAVAAAFLALGYWLKWSKWLLVCLVLLLAWSTAAFAITRFGFDANGRASLPTGNFFRSGVGRVLDIGAGTGRSSIMVLEARPQATLVASDLFAESFDQHFGHGDDPQQRLLANLKAVGVDRRVTIQKADMRQLPFETASFDAVVSAYAMDHVNRDGSRKSLAEAARVLKPGGDFLLMVIGKEPWGEFTFGPLLMHSGARGPAWWSKSMQEAGFDIVEQGTRPATVYILGRRK